MAKKQKMVDVEIDISDPTLLFYAKEAHRRDITLNQLLNEVLRSALDEKDRKIADEDMAKSFVHERPRPKGNPPTKRVKAHKK